MLNGKLGQGRHCHPGRIGCIGHINWLGWIGWFVISAVFSVASAQSPQDTLNNSLGRWKFDDCSAASTLLADSSINKTPAIRSMGVSCGLASSGEAADRSGLIFKRAADGSYPIVTATKTVGFELGRQIAVAAWIKPTVTTQGTLITKAGTMGGNAFTLSLNNPLNRAAPDKLVFTIWVKPLTGTTPIPVSLTSPSSIALNQWTHVAARYNADLEASLGNLFLYINGVEVARRNNETRSIADVSGAIRISSAASTLAYTGGLDEAWVSTNISADFSITHISGGLSCIERPMTFTSSTAASGVVNPNTTVAYMITMTNNNFGSHCGSGPFRFVPSQPYGFSVTPAATFMGDFPKAAVAPGRSTAFSMTARASIDADSGLQPITIRFDNGDPNGAQKSVYGRVPFTLSPRPAGSCSVQTGREIMITDLSVVEDPIRTVYDPTMVSSNPNFSKNGAWTFGKLMEQMAPSAAQAPAMVEAFLNNWATTQTVNGFISEGIAPTAQNLLRMWPRVGGSPTGALILSKAPLHLLAIASRLDKRDIRPLIGATPAQQAEKHAGEGRFVFGLKEDSSSFGLPEAGTVTLILEYRLPGKTDVDVNAWAHSWHQLGAITSFPSESYNVALQAVTNRFTLNGKEPGRVNNSALGRLRTNEYTHPDLWDMHQFELAPIAKPATADSPAITQGFLQLVVLENTPDTSLTTDSAQVSSYINNNQTAILAETHKVPARYLGAPFLGAVSINTLFNTWTASGIINANARHKFALNTCNGCHGLETSTGFVHIAPRKIGVGSELSGFLKGVTVNDPVTGVPRQLNDLKCRTNDLARRVCGAAPLPSQFNCKLTP